MINAGRYVAFLLVTLGLFASSAFAADWPTYLGNMSRNGITSEAISLPLQQQWVFSPVHQPAQGWGNEAKATMYKVGIPFLQGIKHDDSYPVAVVGNDVFFSASGESKIYCIDASTKTIKWVYFTEAPPRCAPTVANGKVYVGADDGQFYCLNAANGSLIWKHSTLRGPERMIGQGYMMPRWPVRTGSVVDDGKVYFTSGLYGDHGLALYALNADTGALVWKNDGIASQDNGASPQGYLLADATRIIVPRGRTMPQAFSRSNGSFVFRLLIGRPPPNGGSYIVLNGNGHLYNGSNSITAYDIDATYKDQWNRTHYGPVIFSWVKARCIVPHSDGTLYMVTDTDVFAIPASEAAAAAGTATGNDTNKEPDWTKCTWRVTGQNVPDALILAGNTLFAGGDGKVVAYNRTNGAVLWNATVEGSARSLAVANGRLFVSTTTGKIYCFGASGSSTVIAPPAVANPYPPDSMTSFYEQTAQSIATSSNINRGFCLIIGGGKGRLAFELAKRTNLRIHMIDPSAQNVADAKAALHQAGMYGGRITVEQGTLSSIRFPAYFANLIVLEEGFFGGTMSTAAADLARVLRPCGGVAFVGQPAGGSAFGSTLSPATVQAWLSQLDVTDDLGRPLAPSISYQLSNSWGRLDRADLAGSADWTHQYATPGNAGGSDDQTVRPPFHLSWFGLPDSGDARDRHSGAPGPLVINGRMFIQGNNVINAVDIYNGTILWRREITGAFRSKLAHDSSNVAAVTDEWMFVAINNKAYKLCGQTGVTVTTYDLPNAGDRRWGWISVVGNTLYGSRTSTKDSFNHWPTIRGNHSEAVFALDVNTGQLKWIYSGVEMTHNTFAVENGKLYLLDRTVTQAQIDQAVAERIEEYGNYVDRLGIELTPDVKKLVALNAATGAKLWERPRDLVDCKVDPSGGEAFLMAKGDLVLVAGAATGSSHYQPEHNRGDYNRRNIGAFNGNTGEKLWGGGKDYQSRPLIMGNLIWAEPWLYNLQTGVQVMEGSQPKKIHRGWGGCGVSTASASTIFFRMSTLAYFDIEASTSIATTNDGQRPSCFINFAPAGGMVVVPEGSSQCQCGYAIQGSFALHSEGEGLPLPPEPLVKAHIFYNGSSFDGNSIYANAADDNAVATDKTPLLPGQTATFANYTSYVSGINGIMVDLPDITTNPTFDDFIFKVGNNNDVSNWATAPTPTSIHVRKGAGVHGRDRITIIWPSNAIQRQWLQVTVKATARTGLPTPEVFYFGNAIGESGDSPTSTRVDTMDEIGARHDPHKSILNPAGIENRHDYNRDGKVDTMDELYARFNRTNFLTELKLITAPE